jgi:Icc protein
MNHPVTQPPVTLLQITDSHFGEEPGSALLGLDTDSSFLQVANLAVEQRGVADWLLATGDISNDGSVASYQRFHQLCQPVAQQARWLPGNHDELSAMALAIADGDELQKLIDLEHWQLILLNSAVPEKVGGAFSEEELDFLQQSLEQSQNKNVLICLHHHPIESGCAWLDQQRVENADAFFAILDRFEHVRAVLWGHIHQEVDTERNGVKLLATPSSCVQFATNSDDFLLDRQAPGYRWLELYADGRLETGVSRLSSVSEDVNYNSAEGY